ncbi:MAG TPA: hypothetical protein VJL89_02195 [Thermodesulfovibrionia bacterium]|nr:hypothetical protein [Thermodesulfovibrionia bacterium]
MTNRDILIREINELPDFIINQLRDIVHYLKLGVNYAEKEEFRTITENEFYCSVEFNDIVASAISEYKKGETEEMDILENEINQN